MKLYRDRIEQIQLVNTGYEDDCFDGTGGLVI